jgi:hypothetical protein
MTHQTDATDADVLTLRRQIAGAKSYLSRLQNQLDIDRRASKPDHAHLDRLYESVIKQQDKFQQLCAELRRREGRTTL